VSMYIASARLSVEKWESAPSGDRNQDRTDGESPLTVTADRDE